MTIEATIKKLRNWSPGLLARNTLYASSWQLIRLAIQTIYLVFVARFLGAQGYGYFAGMVALAASIAPMAGIGFGLVLVQHVSRNPESLPTYWGRSFIVIFITAPLLIMLVLSLSIIFFPETYDKSLLLIIASTEILFVSLISICSNVFQGREKLGWSTFIHVVLNSCRLVGLTILIAVGVPSVEMFAWTYFFSTLTAVIIVLFFTVSKCGKIVWNLNGMQNDIIDGVSFSSVNVIAIAHAEIDKALLLKLSNPSDTGVYSAAVRIVSAASLPLVAYILSTVPRLFRMGQNGYLYSIRTTLKLLYPILFYGFLAGCGLYFFASFLPMILGNDFEMSVSVVRWLFALPMLYGFSSLMLSVLTCTNLQWVRFLVEGMCFVLNIILNLTFIPAYGMAGAVLSILTSQSVLSIILLILLIVALNKQMPKNPFEKV